MPRPPISIVGAGISGLTLSRCLQRRDTPFVLYERDSLEQVGKRHDYAITVSRQKQQLLISDAGLEQKALIGTFVEPHSAGKEQSAARVNRRKLEGILREGLNGVRFGCKIQDVNFPPSGSGRTAGIVFENGERTPEGGIIVAADGAHSAIRKAIAPEAEFTIHPFPAFNGKRRLRRDVYDTQIASHVLTPVQSLEHKIGQSVYRISIDDIKDENVDVSYTYSRPAHDGGESDTLYTPDRPNSGAKDIPPEFIAEVASQHASLPRPFDLIFDREAVKKDRLLTWLMRSVYVPKSRLDAAAGNGMILIGDAAHHTPILGSSGANECIEDAVALAKMLVMDEVGGDRIRAFYRDRVERWGIWVKRGVARLEEMHEQGEGEGEGEAAGAKL